MSENIGHSFKHKKQRLPAEVTFISIKSGAEFRAALRFFSSIYPAEAQRQRVRWEEEEQGSVRSFPQSGKRSLADFATTYLRMPSLAIKAR